MLLLLPSCREPIASKDEALTTLAETSVGREVAFDHLEDAHYASRLAAVHLESSDDFCVRLLWELDGLFFDLADSYRFMDTLNSEMWVSYLDEEWADFPKFEEMVEEGKNILVDRAASLKSVRSRGSGRCWPP